MPVIIPAAAQGVASAYKMFVGAKQQKQGRQLLNGLQYPTEAMPQEISDMASEGLPQQQYDKAMKDIQRQQQQAISASMDRRGGLATVGTLTQLTNDATVGLNAKDAEMRNQNRRYVAGVKRDLFDKNVRSKYNRDYDYGMGLLGMGHQNTTNGFDGLLGAGASFAGGMNGGSGGAAMGGNPRISNSPLTYFPG